MGQVIKGVLIVVGGEVEVVVAIETLIATKTLVVQQLMKQVYIQIHQQTIQ